MEFLDEILNLTVPACFSAILVGFRCFFDYPAKPTIPVYLFIGGMLCLLTRVASKEWHKLGNFLISFVLAVTGFYWLHFGGDLNHEDPQANYCSETLPLTALLFNCLSLYWIFYYLISLAIRIVRCTRGCTFSQRNSYRERLRRRQMISLPAAIAGG